LLSLVKFLYNDQSMDNSNQTPNPELKPETSGKTAMGMVELGSIIKRYLADIDKLKEQMKEYKAMYDDAFTNDATYQQNNEKVKELTKAKNAVKQTIVKQPAVETTILKIKDLKGQIKDAQEALSGYLQEYYRVSGTNMLEDDQGEILQIVPVFKIVRKPK